MNRQARIAYHLINACFITETDCTHVNEIHDFWSVHTLYEWPERWVLQSPSKMLYIYISCFCGKAVLLPSAAARYRWTIIIIAQGPNQALGLPSLQGRRMNSNPCMDYGGYRPLTADQGCAWLYGCRSKSVGAGLNCSLGGSPALTVTHNADTVSVCGLWHYVSVCLFLLTFCSPEKRYDLLRVHSEVRAPSIDRQRNLVNSGFPSARSLPGTHTHTHTL